MSEKARSLNVCKQSPRLSFPTQHHSCMCVARTREAAQYGRSVCLFVLSVFAVRQVRRGRNASAFGSELGACVRTRCDVICTRTYNFNCSNGACEPNNVRLTTDRPSGNASDAARGEDGRTSGTHGECLQFSRHLTAGDCTISVIYFHGPDRSTAPRLQSIAPIRCFLTFWNIIFPQLG